MQLFVVLALISLATTWYHMLQYCAVSYSAWAHEMGEVIHPTMWSDNGYIAFGVLRPALGRWLEETLFRDAWEIVIEWSGRYWWSQQIFLGAAAWSVYVGI